MACVIVPAVEATVVAIASKVTEKREATTGEHHEVAHTEESHKIPFSKKLKWLSYLQFGGAALLAYEHVWHGEIVPFFPFLTAMSDKGDMMEMFHEMATTGVGMAALTTVVWAGMLAVVSKIEKKAASEVEA